MIFHHTSILTNEAQTDLGIVPQKVFGYDQHLAAIRLRLKKLIAAMPNRKAAFSCIETYLCFSPVSYEPDEMLEDMMQSAQMVAFVTDLRHAWQDVSRSEMEQYYQETQQPEAAFEMAFSAMPAYSQGTLNDKLQTITLPEFLEVLSQYNS